MATKWWFDSVAAPGLMPPDPDAGDWDHTNLVTYRRLNHIKQGSVSTLLTGGMDIGDDITDKDAVRFVGVSSPIEAASVGGVLSANRIRIQVRAAELNNSCNLKLSAKVYLIDSTGTFKAVLMPLTREATEFPVIGSETNRLFNQIMAGTQAVADRDRIVLELGWGGLPSSSGADNNHTGRLSIGDDSATDLTQGNETETSAFNPWMTFGTDNLTFFDEDQTISFLGNLTATTA
jgi:hypothetical protein